jgi:hypothetical protein
MKGKRSSFEMMILSAFDDGDEGKEEQESKKAAQKWNNFIIKLKPHFTAYLFRI